MQIEHMYASISLYRLNQGEVMARVTVEDCLNHIPNRFKLVLVAAKRAEGLGLGSQSLVDRRNDKNPVVALREIASNKDIAKNLEDSYIQSLQRIQPEIELEMRESDLELGNDWSEQIALLSKELESLGSVEDPDGAASESMFDSNEFDEDE